MRKLKLRLNELAVETFATREVETPRGTVDANATRFQTGGCYSCNATICVETCADTCDNSLDYCTCACSDDCTLRCHDTQVTGFCGICYQEP